MVNRLIFTLVASIFLGCSNNSFDNTEQLWSYLKDHKSGYHMVKNVKGVEYALTYRPTDIMVEQELNGQATEDQIKDLRKKYGSQMYFDLSMSTNGQELLSTKANDMQRFGELVGQLSFLMEDKIHLISKNRDTLELMDYSYPRLYGLSNSTKMILVYPRREKLLSQDFFLVTIEDLGFETGEVTFKINSHNIVNQPGLIFKN